MKRICSFEKRFWEVHDDECQKEKDPLCSNWACECAIGLKRNMVARCVDKYRQKYPVCYWLTLFHPHGVCDEGRLGKVTLATIKAFNLRLLRKARVKNLRVVGHIDIVLQDYTDGSQRKSRWHVHFHLIMWADETEAKIKQKIYATYNKFGSKRVAKLDLIYNTLALPGYMIKHPKEHKKKLISSKGWQCAPDYDIRGRFRREIVDFYASCDIEDAFLLMGFRRYGINIHPWVS